MNKADLKNEVNFGLDNLEKVYESINYILNIHEDIIKLFTKVLYTMSEQ